MPSRRPSRGRPFFAAVLVALAFAIAPTTTLAGAPSPGGSGDFHPRLAHRPTGIPGHLHGRLAEVVSAVLAGRLDGLALAGLEVARPPAAAGVAVSIRLAPVGGTSALRTLTGLGGRIANRSGNHVEAYLPAAALAKLASLDGIDEAAPIIRPVPLGNVGLGNVGEGVALHHADQWQAAGIVGAGVKVGIIDGGFVGLLARLGTELPPGVHARCYREVGLFSSTAASCEANTEHGTAVAETISDMAPGASLYLADPLSIEDMTSTVAWMVANGVKVINVSLGFAYEGPGDGSSPAGSVYSVVNQAVKGGALWVNAAGNAGQDGWVGPWKDADHNSILEFQGQDEGDAISLQAGDTIVATLRWNDKWGASANDYDLYVYGANGSTPLAASEDPQDGTGDPVESLSFTASTNGLYQMVVTKSSGAAVSRLQLLVLTTEDAPLQYRTPDDTLPSPADSANPGMVSVGAVAFDSPDQIETFSSRGPTVDGRIKPDFVAADCTTTSSLNPFCGTSESAPYASGAAALVLSAKPTLTPAQVASWMRNRSVPLGSPVPNSTFGAGRMDLGAPPAPPTPTTLSYVAQPRQAIAGLAFGPAPSIQILDQDGLLIPTGAGSTAPVTLAFGANPAGATLTCPDGLTQNAAAGIVTFANCSISAAGTGFTLVATSGALPPLASSPFDVLPAGAAPPPVATLTASTAAIVWGKPVTLTAQLALAPDALLVPSLAARSVDFQASGDGATWASIGARSTDAGGAAAFVYRPVTNLYYRAAVAAAPDLGAVTSAPARVTVRQTAILRPSTGGITKTVARNTSVQFTTTVRPARADVPPGVVTYQVYRRVGSTWRLVLTQRVVPDAGGSAALVVTFDQAGSWYVRSMANPTKVNANSLWTAAEHYFVR